MTSDGFRTPVDIGEFSTVPGHPDLEVADRQAGDACRNGHPILDLGRHNGLLASVGEACLRHLHQHLERVHLKQGQVVIDADAPLTRIWFPETCVVSLVIQMENGSSAEVAAVGPEGALGYDALLGIRRSLIQATVQAPGDALCIATRDFMPVMDESDRLRIAMWRNMARIQAETMQLAACHALHPARARLARFLLMAQDRTGEPVMHLTQELLAEVLGVQRTTVTAAALALMEQGLILYRRGHIDICNRPGLEAATCECYAAIRQFSRYTAPTPCN